jgi:hypothetical protein
MRWITLFLTSLIVSLAVSGFNLYYALKPDLAWCAKYHLICHWGGRWELDPAWHSEEARNARLLHDLARAVLPREWHGPLDIPNDVTGHPQER